MSVQIRSIENVYTCTGEELMMLAALRPRRVSVSFVVVAAIAVLLAVVVAPVGSRWSHNTSQALVLPFPPGQVIHTVVDYSVTSLETGNTEVKQEETWIRVGRGGQVDALRAFLRDSNGNLLQDGFSDAASARVGTHFSESGETIVANQPLAPEAIMWTNHAIEQQLTGQGFVQVEDTSIATWKAAVFERETAVDMAPRDGSASLGIFEKMKGQIGLVQRVYIGIDPFGFDLGEEAFYRDATGAQFPAMARTVRTVDITSASRVPAGTFDWPHDR